MGGVPDTFRIDSSQNLFNATNVKEKALISVREGLVEESNKKEYIDNSYITDKNIDNFLKVVWFVVDDKLPQDYIKEIIKNHPSIIPPDSELISIFNEIRNKQSELKNTNVPSMKSIWRFAVIMPVCMRRWEHIFWNRRIMPQRPVSRSSGIWNMRFRTDRKSVV